VTARPELISLDLGDTLIHPQPSWAEVYLAAAADAGVPLPRDRLAAGVAAGLASGLLDDAGPFEASPAASFERICRFDAAIMAGAGVPDLPASFYRTVAARFARPDSWAVFPDVAPALARFDAAGIRLAIVSNWVWDGPRLVAELGLADRFGTIVISDRLGYGKPHPAIFRAALEAMGVPAAQALHVGDSYPKDVVGALGAGMAAMLVTREAQPEPGARGADEGLAVTTVRDLLEVADRLDLA
jgi:HAD superfamily hydrolase (TIGR01509 family)